MQNDDLTIKPPGEEPEQPLLARRPARRIAAGVAVSIALHALLLAGLLINLDLPSQEVAPEEVVSVEMVPEPEPEPEPEPPAEPAKPQEEPAPAPAPPPPPPQADEEVPEQSRAPIPTLDPVFRFGEETRGIDKPQDGDGARAADPDPTPPEQPQEPADEAQTPDVSKLEAPEAAAARAEPPEDMPQQPVPDAEEKPPEPDATAASTLPEMLATQLSDAAEEVPQETAEEASVPVATVVPQKRPDNPGVPSGAAAAGLPPLREARRIYSQSSTGDSEAMTAMAGLPAGVRAGRLCSTELREQLRRGAPAYEPELLPSYTLAPGTTALTVGQGAFRAGGQWYNVGFQCTVDEGATEVRSFSLAVGKPVPRSDWQRRGFPQF